MISGLPERLQELRLRFQYSQRQVARMLGVSPSLISCYEMGERTPSTENLLALSYLYKCSTDYLLGRQSTGQKTVVDVTGLTEAQIGAVVALVESIRGSQ